MDNTEWAERYKGCFEDDSLTGEWQKTQGDIVLVQSTELLVTIEEETLLLSSHLLTARYSQ